jgi:CHASE2 domain-containing sensor protein
MAHGATQKFQEKIRAFSLRFSVRYESYGPPAVRKAWRSRPRIFRLRAWSVVILVALWNISITTSIFSSLLQFDNQVCETLREIRDLNLHIQLRLYQALTLFRPNSLVSSNVTLVYIDNNTHWTMLRGVSPTNRAFLAALIRNLMVSKPSVIALDIEFLVPFGRQGGTDDETRWDDNEELRQAIQEATRVGIPVILGGAFIRHDNRNYRLREIFHKQDLQPDGWDCQEKRCSGFGYVNTPFDRRLIPTSVEVEPDGKSPMDSFALSVAKARVGPLNTLPKIDELTEDHTFGSFLREEHFKIVQASDIWARNPHALNQCADQIVMVGGRWKDLEGFGSFTDEHLSAVGMMSGLVLQANYVESLLNPSENSREVPLWLGIVADLLLGFAIYVTFTVLEGPSRLWVLAVAAVTPLLAAYVSLVNFNRFLDFLFPIELYVLHIAYELIEERLTHKRTEAVPATPVNEHQPV